MALTAAQEAKVKQMIEDGGMVDKVLQRQAIRDEIATIIADAKVNIDAKQLEVTNLIKDRDAAVQTKKDEIAALGLADA